MVVQQPTVFWLQKLINFQPQGKIVIEQQQQNEQTSEEWKEQMMKKGKIKRDNRKKTEDVTNTKGLSFQAMCLDKELQRGIHIKGLFLI